MIRATAVALALTLGLSACSSEPKAKPTPAGVPHLVTNDDGKPTGFTKTSSTPKTVTKSRAIVIKDGDGTKVPAGGSVTAQYLGQVYPQGAVFDSSWKRGMPATFPLTGVIPCWRDLLPGHTIGSRVVLLCASDDAYGDTPPPGAGIKAGDDLMFVVDILNAN